MVPGAKNTNKFDVRSKGPDGVEGSEDDVGNWPKSKVVRRAQATTHSFPQGFTVLELGIALVLLGLILGVSIPTVNLLSGAELKKQIGLFHGLIREVYARTALSGVHHRLVIEMDRSVYWVEQTEEAVLLGNRSQELSNEGKAALAIIDERIEDLEADQDDPKASTMLQLLKGPSWSRVDDEIGKSRKMHPDVRFAGIWADHLQERAKSGQVALHFFPAVTAKTP